MAGSCGNGPRAIYGLMWEGFLKVTWKRVPSQLASTFIKGFVSLPPLEIEFHHSAY